MITYVASDPEEDVAALMLKDLMFQADQVNRQVKTWNEIANANQQRHCANAQPFDPDVPCGFCKKLIDPNLDKPVRHHHHYPDFEFEFWSHQQCNLNAKTSGKLVVLMHNLKAYDSIFLIKAVTSLPSDVKVEVIRIKVFCHICWL